MRRGLGYFVWVPRRNSTVKPNHDQRSRSSRGSDARVIRTIGAIDIHFHGAFGIDLMKAETTELDRLSRLLWRNGVAGFCPTTLSAGQRELYKTVARLDRKSVV